MYLYQYRTSSYKLLYRRSCAEISLSIIRNTPIYPKDNRTEFLYLYKHMYRLVVILVSTCMYSSRMNTSCIMLMHSLFTWINAMHCNAMHLH